jgi:hypothetical protein
MWTGFRERRKKLSLYLYFATNKTISIVLAKEAFGFPESDGYLLGLRSLTIDSFPFTSNQWNIYAYSN